MKIIPDLGFYMEPNENVNTDPMYKFDEVPRRGSMDHSELTFNGKHGPLVHNSPSLVATGVDVSDKDYTIEIKVKTNQYAELIRCNESGNKEDGYNYDGYNIWYTNGSIFVGRIGYPGAQYFRWWRVYPVGYAHKPEYTSIVIVKLNGNFTVYANGEKRWTLDDIKQSPLEPTFLYATTPNCLIEYFAVTLDVALPQEAFWDFNRANYSNKSLANSHAVYKAASKELTIDDVKGRYLMDIVSKGSWIIALFTDGHRVGFLRPRGLDSGSIPTNVEFVNGKLKFTLDDGSEIIAESVLPQHSVSVNFPGGSGIMNSEGTDHNYLKAGSGVKIDKIGKLNVIRSGAVKSKFASESDCVIFEESTPADGTLIKAWPAEVNKWSSIPTEALLKRASLKGYFLPQGKMFVPKGSYVVELRRNYVVNLTDDQNVSIRVLNKTLNEEIMKVTSKVNRHSQVVNFNESTTLYLPIDCEIDIQVYISGSTGQVDHLLTHSGNASLVRLAFKKI